MPVPNPTDRDEPEINGEQITGAEITIQMGDEELTFEDVSLQSFEYTIDHDIVPHGMGVQVDQREYTLSFDCVAPSMTVSEPREAPKPVPEDGPLPVEQADDDLGENPIEQASESLTVDETVEAGLAPDAPESPLDDEDEEEDSGDMLGGDWA